MSVPELVLLPGLDGTGDLFRPFTREIEADTAFRVVRYTSPEVSSYAECTTVAERQLHGSAPFVLVGESFSGPIAVSIAARSPLLGRWATPDLRQCMADAMAQVSPAAVRTRLREIAHVDVSAELSRVQTPILYLRATHDRLVPRSSADRIVSLAPRAKVVEIAAPHMLLQCAPRECARAIRNFVRGGRRPLASS